MVGEDTAHILLEGENGSVGTVVGSMAVAGRPSRTQDRLDPDGRDRAHSVLEDELLSVTGPDGSETVRIDLDAAYQQSYSKCGGPFRRMPVGGSARSRRTPEDNLKTLTLVDDVYAKAG